MRVRGESASDSSFRHAQNRLWRKQVGASKVYVPVSARLELVVVRRVLHAKLL